MSVTRHDAKVHVPGIHQPITVADLPTVISQKGAADALHRMAYETEGGKAITQFIADDVTRGRFEVEELEERALEQFFEEYWPCFWHQVVQQRSTGAGIAIKTRPNERVKDLSRPWTSAPGKPIRWVYAETRHVNTFGMVYQPPRLAIMDWADEWQWFNQKVHPTRMEVLQLIPSQEAWQGYGDVQAVYGTLLSLHNLLMGVLDREVLWAINRIGFPLKPESEQFISTGFYDKAAAAMNKSNYTLLDEGREPIQLEGSPGHGIEMWEILLEALSLGTRIPSIMLRGVVQGATTGSETDLTNKGTFIANQQSKYSYFIKDILQREYAIDAFDLKWNVDFFISEEKMLDIEMKKIQLERMESGEDLALLREMNGGSKQEKGKPVAGKPGKQKGELTS